MDQTRFWPLFDPKSSIYSGWALVRRVMIRCFIIFQKYDFWDDFEPNNGQNMFWAIIPKYGFKEVIALQGHYRGSFDHLEIAVHLPYINSQLDPSSRIALSAWYFQWCLAIFWLFHNFTRSRDHYKDRVSQLNNQLSYKNPFILYLRGKAPVL